MNRTRTTVPTIFDYADLRLRVPVRRADDPFLNVAGLAGLSRSLY